MAGCVDEGPDLSVTASAATVSDYAYSGCSTSVVLGLSRQIADEVGCEHPGGLVPFSETGGLVFTSSSVLPYLEADAKTHLVQVAASHSVQVNSAFRTIAQQYLLVRWHAEGRCGITATASVGNSNHESGRAVDLANYSSLVGTMSAHGWAHDVPGDPVHFDHLASDDIRGEDVLAFQTLWNRNHPGDRIAEDGDYGPQTEARLKQSPATGFAIGASCVTPAAEATLVSVDGPDNAPPATRAHFSITIENGTGADWPATATLVAPADTQRHDASWIDGTQITALGQDVPAGSMAELSFDVMTPPATDTTPISEQLALVDGSATLGTVRVALTVVPDMHTPQSSDGGDTHDFGEVSGGCSTGNGSGFGALVLVLGALVRRRRR
jgi:MYXO-CTERM domain-containing protein